jgi:hypothetical protein
MTGTLSSNNCQAKAQTFDGTPHFQMNLKAKDSTGESKVRVDKA